ncbi:hypothetical protein HRR83_001917 [Exophiala dermatitidis]|uniref:Hypercellular protein HypA n=2 Tax=Exophiala dermatitidis TaxID=5970 RepID=H6BZF5_EXODN|nr:uncharacterized protein HMPREF1120_05072 [Exophiala dermatitidis NIH/UT8656]KAJ4514433.1 hypothetical protein HRR73_005461 [Exophiala dermatitidis]EHY57018.1 hypothetical protein HMPREF1120_05072 [Exophiala dermatitidis NIH/UT8656]KAJ4523801.1 hypothetical protein HRR74_001994 [Exophiala dermatitidis]KAJ4537261.1 hypothetical protein HRR76_005274 [Exophiala dermatitidis]KAJ4555141.1 hypothetical protein HRR77_001082 [Exophiala dermatitidis]
MGYNPFLPTAGARVNVLCVPAGPVTPGRFQDFTKLLQDAANAKLNHLTSSSSAQDGPRTSSEDNCILYEISPTQDPGRPHLFPFETNSRCQILLGLIDGERIEDNASEFDVEDGASTAALSDLEAIKTGFSQQSPSHLGLLVRQLVYFSKKRPTSVDRDIIFMSDTQGGAVAREFEAELSNPFTAKVEAMLNELKDQPISMVPGANAQACVRSSDTPNPSTPSPASTPVPTPSSGSSIVDADTQSDTSRGRFKIVHGMYQLQCGLWSDALSLLADGASMAQNGHDHLWHGKALESLLLCMLLLSWSGQGFTVPQVCRSLPNRSGIFQTEVSSKTGDSHRALAELMPPMVESILELYAKVSNLDLGGSLQDVLRESRIRAVNILVLVKSNGGILTQGCLDQLVLGRMETPAGGIPVAGEPVAVSKAGLANILIETLQASQSSNYSTHFTSILVAVTSSLSVLGLSRKHAFYLKQMVQQFVTKLIEARKIGASAVGIHPAAGLPPVSHALQGILPEMATGIRKMLSLVADAYGAPVPPVAPPRHLITADINVISEKVRTWAAEHSYGDLVLKLEMLRTCISVCEALPDVPAGLHFTSYILQASKRVVTLPRQSTNVSPPLMSVEEQARLLDSMNRAALAAPRLGFPKCSAEYWDDFLVRDVQVFERDDASRLIPHKSSDLAVRGSGLTDTIRDPFIYNPFAKTKSTVAAPVLVAGELASFAVILQNPLEVEVEIEDISLVTKGCCFVPSHHSIVLGPLSVQTFALSGTPTEDGDLEIVGCRARIRNCYDQEFLIFREDWKPYPNLKHNAVGTVRRRTNRSSKTSDDHETLLSIQLDLPVPASLKLKIIRPQPRITIQSDGLGTPSIMLLEGESRTFDLKLFNKSTDVPADFILVTTEDSVSSRLQEALSNKDLSSAEIHEVQKQLVESPAVVVRKRNVGSSATILGPGQAGIYEVTIVGRPGLVSATVQADYAYLGSPSQEVKGTFYTRQVRFSLSITVNGSIEIPRCNILPIHSDFAWRSNTTLRHGSEQGPHPPVQTTKNNIFALSDWYNDIGTGSDNYCMLSLDLRNVWPRPLSIDIQARKRSLNSDLEKTEWEEAFTVLETLQPGYITRVVLLIPRLFIEDSHAQIPSLETQKQFVVTTSKLSAEAEAASRESFWYREELLKCLRGTWKDESSGRCGEIDLRKGIRLSPRLVDVLKLDHVDLTYALQPCDGQGNRADGDASTPVRQIGRSHFILKSETFATLSVKVHNRTQDSLRLLLRLQPSLRNQPHTIALDLSRRFLWSGVLQRALHPAVESGGTAVAELGIIALVPGDYNITASVEEIKARRAKSGDSVSTGSGRRIWHARTPCLIDAVNDD